MEKFTKFDLITPDGIIHSIDHVDNKCANIEILINNIANDFVGFDISKDLVFFNLKSTLAQLGLTTTTKDISLNKKNNLAEVQVEMRAFSLLGEKMLSLLNTGQYIGKLFADDDRRKVVEPSYLLRMFGRCDLDGNPLLSLGNHLSKKELVLEKKDGYATAFLHLKNGVIKYENAINNFLPTLAKILKNKNFETRRLLQFYQKWIEGEEKTIKENEILIVRTLPLHISTVFAKVKNSFLTSGYQHSSACVLQPNTQASGDIYELFGSSKTPIEEIPLEFYTLSPYQEYVFFEDRDQLQTCLEKDSVLFDAFKSAPAPDNNFAATYVVKGSQLLNLTQKDWIAKEGIKHDLPGIFHPSRQALLINKYIEQQPAYTFLKAMEMGEITSQGILLSRYFPSPMLKGLLISNRIQHLLKGIYFLKPSRSHDYFFSHEDRAFLLDLAKFAIPVYWVDEISKKVLQYVVKPNKETGMFVPIKTIPVFLQATIFGVYGSNLIEGNFENTLEEILRGIIEIKNETNHHLLSKEIPIALLTGGGPGAMEVGNRVAKKIKILSCANIVDFRQKDKSVVNEQKQNPHIDAKMTYRLDRLVERQAEFYLDFPIFLPGGIGMDFEYCLEEVRRKVGATQINPMLLLGPLEHWSNKITPRFQCNLKAGTIKGSEWISNCFYYAKDAKQAIKIYKDFFEKKLPIGKDGPVYEDGFCKNYT
jgi:predicted Rossmann-fold nucleotide-binding protein